MAKPDPSSDLKYNVTIACKHFDLTEPIKEYVTEKINKVSPIANRVHHVAVTLDAQGINYTCSVVMNFPQFHIKVHATTENIYSAIDKCADKLFALVTRYKDKLASKRFEHLSSVDIDVNVIKAYKDDLKRINDDIEEENSHKKYDQYALHEIVAKETISLKTLTQEEAVIKMEMMSDVPFIIYRSEEDQKLKVIYRRNDENYSLIQIS